MDFAFSWSWALHTWFVTGPVHDKHHCQFLILLAAPKFCPSVYFQASHLAQLVHCVHRFQLTILPWMEKNFHFMTLERKAGLSLWQPTVPHQSKNSGYLTPQTLLSKICYLFHFKIFLSSYLQVFWSQNQINLFLIGSGGCFTICLRKTSQYNILLNFVVITQPFKSGLNCTGIAFEGLFNVSCLHNLKNSKQSFSKRLLSPFITLSAKSSKAAIPFSH